MSETKKLPAEKAPAAAGAEDAKMVKLLDKLITHQKRVEAATLAAAIATNRGTPLSIAEMLELARDVQFARYPQPKAAEYLEWVKTKDEKLNFVHK
jgi:enoyl-CoA hydratase/carnithine racemase